MAVPSFLNGTFRYATDAAVVDVQDIIDTLYAELVTGLGWTCTVGGIGISPTTYKTPVGSQGEYFTIELTRDSATRLSWVCKDHYGLQINNQTTTKQDIDVGGTDIYYYTGIDYPYVCVDSARATGESMWVCQIDPYPETNNAPVFVAFGGPRTNAGNLTYDEWEYGFWMVRIDGDTAYNTTPAADWNADHVMYSGVCLFKTQSGALLFAPVEYQHANYYFGKIPQALMCDGAQAALAELVVPIDTGVTGTFKVLSAGLFDARKMVFRKA